MGMGRALAQQSTAPARIKLNEFDPHLGVTATFAVVYPAAVKTPLVAVTCLQNTSVVYNEANKASYTFSHWVAAGRYDCRTVVHRGARQSSTTSIAPRILR